jgi:predicted acylesterase/phospholipase RssA
VRKPGPERDEALVGQPDPWRLLRRQQDRRRYLRIVTPRRTGRDKPRAPRPADGIPRSAHPLLGSPATMTRTATNHPQPREVEEYFAHSCDLTMRGGVANAIVYPLAACGLAENYVFRRIGGSSAGAVSAAATAAAELGRGAPDPQHPPQLPSVVPGFAGLAQVIGWLAGEDVPLAGRPSGRYRPEQWRLTRMFQPAAQTRSLFRVVAALLRPPGTSDSPLSRRLSFALMAPPGKAAKLVMLLLWAGWLVGWSGLTATLVRGAKATGDGLVAPIAASAALLLAFAAAGAFTTVVCFLLGSIRLLRRKAETGNFGLVPGIPTARRAGGISRWLDRRAGVPAAGAVPPLVTWLADRLDDLAGMAGGAERRAVTFGDLWLGTTERTPEDADLLRRAARDPELRTIELALTATNLAEHRPYRLPFRSASAAGEAPFLFCETCLEGVLPQRIVTQMVKASPATETEHGCPRHSGGVLRELPEPWDLPVAAATRMSMSMPGLLHAVPLYSTGPARPGVTHDAWGRVVTDAPPASAVPVLVHTHWFCDGGVTSDLPVHAFDALLPRWPTFGFILEHYPEDSPHEALRLPAQDAAPTRRAWHPVDGALGFAGALLGTALGWRDRLQADVPGFRGRIAQIRQSGDAGRANLFLPQDQLLQLAMRGLHAGAVLHDRFTGPDDEVTGQTQTDRYRWIRLRMALREYHAMSMDIAARLPLYSDLANTYEIPVSLAPWTHTEQKPGMRDPSLTDAGTVITTLRAMSAGGVLDFDTDDGAPPIEPVIRLLPPE